MEYSLKIQTRFPDFDTQKFVNHSKICTYIELTYLTFLQERINPDWSYSRLPIVLKKEETDYLIPITPKANLLCKLSLNKVWNTSFELDVEVCEETNQKIIYTKGKRILVYIGLENPKPLKIESNIMEKLKEYLYN